MASAEPTAEILARLHTVEMAAATPQRIASTEPSAAILDRLHAVEAAAAAARDSADAAVRQVTVLPATPVAATSRRDTIMGVAHDMSPSTALGGGGFAPWASPPLRILQRGEEDAAAGLTTPRTARASPDLASMGWQPAAVSPLPALGAPQPGAPQPPHLLPWRADFQIPGAYNVPAGSIGRQWLPAGTVKAFTGEFAVGSTCPSVNPIEWSRQVREALQNRHIPPERWVSTSTACLEPWVADRFRASRMGDDNTALAARLMGLDMHEDPFLETGWDDFVRWLMLTYVTADKIEAMELRVTAMTCSSVKLVDQFIIDFNTAAMSSDYMRFMVDPAVPSSSIMESVQRSLDTVPRRVAFRRAMPEFISQSFMRREAQERLANANWLFTLAAMQAVARTEAKVGLAAVERGELRSADVNHMHSHVVNHMAAALGPAPPSPPLIAAPPAVPPTPPAESSAAETLLLLRSLHTRIDELQGGHEEDPELYLRIEDVTPNPPAPALLEERRQSKACLACGEKSTHWRFAECPKLLADPTVKAKIDAAMASVRRRRPVPARGARVHVISAGDDDHDQP